MSDLIPEGFLPPFLLETEMLEQDDLPLQVSLLTMELAAQRQWIEAMERQLDQMEHNMAQLILSNVKPLNE